MMHNKTCPNHSYQFLKDFLFVILMILFMLTSPKYVRADTYYEYLVPQWEYHPGGTTTYTWCPTDPNTQVPDDQYRPNPGTWPSLASFPNDSAVVDTTSWPYTPSYNTYQYTLHYSGQEPQTYTAGLNGYGGFIVTDWFSAGEVSNIYMAVRGGHYNYGHGVYMFIQDEKTRHWTKLAGSTTSTISYNIPIEQRYHGRCRIGISFSNHVGSQINTGTMYSTVKIGRIRLTKSPHNYNLPTGTTWGGNINGGAEAYYQLACENCGETRDLISAHISTTELGAKFATDPFTVGLVATPGTLEEANESIIIDHENASYQWQYRENLSDNWKDLPEGEDGWSGTQSSILTFRPGEYMPKYFQVMCKYSVDVKTNIERINTDDPSTYDSEGYASFHWDTQTWENTPINVWAGDAQESFNASTVPGHELGRFYFGRNPNAEDPSVTDEPLQAGSTIHNLVQFVKADDIHWEYSTDSGESWTTIPGSSEFNSPIDVTIAAVDVGPEDKNHIVINNGSTPIGESIADRFINAYIDITANNFNLKKFWIRPVVTNEKSRDCPDMSNEQPVRYNMETFYKWVQADGPDGQPVELTKIQLGGKTFQKGHDAFNEESKTDDMIREGLIKVDKVGDSTHHLYPVGYKLIERYHMPTYDDATYMTLK